MIQHDRPTRLLLQPQTASRAWRLGSIASASSSKAASSKTLDQYIANLAALAMDQHQNRWEMDVHPPVRIYIYSIKGFTVTIYYKIIVLTFQILNPVMPAKVAKDLHCCNPDWFGVQDFQAEIIIFSLGIDPNFKSLGPQIPGCKFIYSMYVYIFIYSYPFECL